MNAQRLQQIADAVMVERGLRSFERDRASIDRARVESGWPREAPRQDRAPSSDPRVRVEGHYMGLGEPRNHEERGRGRTAYRASEGDEAVIRRVLMHALIVAAIVAAVIGWQLAHRAM